MSVEGCARKNPLIPPLTKTDTNPSANSAAAVKRRRAPYSVPIQSRQMIADHESRRNEEAGAGHAVEDQEDARRHQDRERDEPDDGGDEPRPRREGEARERHASGPQVERRGDEVERAEQLRDAEYPDRDRPQRLPHALPRAGVLADGAERCICRPPRQRRSITDEERRHKHEKRQQGHPKRRHVDAAFYVGDGPPLSGWT